MAVFELGLGLKEGTFETAFGTQQMALTKLIRYPCTPAGKAGVNAHKDSTFLTILAPGQTPGLQVENALHEWISVPYVPGGLVINIGEMMQGMTGNYLVATPHRVIAEDLRYSAAYFHGPSLHTQLVRLPMAEEFAAAVAASPRHSGAGWMPTLAELESGVKTMQSENKVDTYGTMLWNYFSRSYPKNMALHYSSDKSAKL
eukprot:gnl/MRDRNA2_/MRDRNA2_254103_c0_seq1.p1 gnl/MRDRNA2_/MRDRNA2_254103_c0~~gnl/MRDRNA2_/MRDRNA2_254103_c0_seq1.p1  ORF type:complete len:210 (+),score=38.18 gnl/MRDRNA2_/MRDRNA2_254103_c0_seq1:30-632(+)